MDRHPINWINRAGLMMFGLRFKVAAKIGRRIWILGAEFGFHEL